MRTVKALQRESPSPREPNSGFTEFPGLHITGPEHPLAGGKAKGLAHLQAAGLPIPPTRVILSSSFDAFLSFNGVETSSQPILTDTTWPTGWQERITAEAASLGRRLAVRSSGMSEDGRKRSFAGVHHTALNVRPEKVAAAVLAVWQSAFDPTARAYSEHFPGMAVVLQPMIEPHCAGVLFTVNPQNGSWREMVVEAVQGQGEALVSGRQAPQWWIVRRPRKLPGQRLWNRMRLRVVQEDLVPQSRRWVVGSDGQVVGQPSGASGALMQRPACLALCRLALRAERAFGEPIDLEWAYSKKRFVLLQARPITTITTPRNQATLWTRRFFGERFIVPPTPLSWSLLSPIFEHFIAYPKVQARYLGGGPSIQLIQGYPYLNATIFRHLLFKLPGAPPPRFMLELIPPDEVRAWRTRFSVQADWSIYLAVFRETFTERRWQRFAFNPLTNHAIWDRYRERFASEIHALGRPLLGSEDGLRRIQIAQSLIQEYLSIHICSLLFANLWYQLLEGALASWIGPGDWLEQLAVCPPGNLTLRTNEALWELARQATAEDRAKLEQGDADGEFSHALDTFLSTYGHRAESSWELFSPRWRDDPARLAPLLSPDVSAPSRRAAEVERRFCQAKTAVLGQVGGGKRLVLRGLIFITRRYLLLRENQRFIFDQLLCTVQQIFLELAEPVGLTTPTDVQWLTIDEITGLLKGTRTELPDLSERKAHHEQACRYSPPVFLRDDLPVDEILSGSRLEGQGISPGRVRGRVRILRSALEGHRLSKGEILVATAIDPGWTPLLMRSGALVLELGSLLSHGAVIAREYGIPGVVNISGITHVLRDGQEITVDGARGLVWVHDPAHSS